VRFAFFALQMYKQSIISKIMPVAMYLELHSVQNIGHAAINMQ